MTENQEETRAIPTGEPGLTFAASGMSPQIDKLAASLAKAQGQMRAAEKSSVNPHFKSRYADLASIIDAAREPMASNGISYTQIAECGDRANVICYTQLMHESGQWIRAKLSIAAKGADPQSVGSVLTYSRRYALAAILGLASDDEDDGNSQSNGPAKAQENGKKPVYKHIEVSAPEPVKNARPAPAPTQPANHQAFVEAAREVFAPPASVNVVSEIAKELAQTEGRNAPANKQEVEMAWQEWCKMYSPDSTAKFKQYFPAISMRNATQEQVAEIWAHIQNFAQTDEIPV